MAAARSLPAFGSLNSWHQISSPERIAGRRRFFCASVAVRDERRTRVVDAGPG
jgi:hypothetical protein